MKIIEQYVEIMEGCRAEEILWRIEAAARNCYKSEGKNDEKDPHKRDALIRAAVKRGHTSVLEHGVVSFRVICNRGVSHEWVRHRIGWSYSQESTRYCNYGHSAVTFIWPSHKLGMLPGTSEGVDALIFGSRPAQLWLNAMRSAELAYIELLDEGWKPEDARDPLGIALKTEIVCTANIVALRHFFKLRCAKASHPQIRQLALQLLAELNTRLPILFGDQYEQLNKEEA